MDRDTIINYVLNTPENTNPAVLDGMLKALESGGGGGGDFSTAEVTVILTTEESGTVDYEEWGTSFRISESNTYTGIVYPENHKDTVVLYKNVGYIDSLSLHFTDESVAWQYKETPITTGDITWDSENNYFVVTGDGSITVKVGFAE